MPTDATVAPNVKQAVPFFSVTDIDASLRFYVDGLGFVLTSQGLCPCYPVHLKPLAGSHLSFGALRAPGPLCGSTTGTKFSLGAA